MLMSRKKLQHCDSGQKIGIISIHGSAMTPNTADNFVYMRWEQVGILIRKSVKQGGAEHLLYVLRVFKS